MLAVWSSSYKGVELGAAEAGRDIDPYRLPLRMGRGRISVSSKGFEDVFTEGFEVGDLGGVGGVLEAVFVGCVAEQGGLVSEQLPHHVGVGCEICEFGNQCQYLEESF